MASHRIVFQPIVTLPDRAVLGFEALGRFDDRRPPTDHLDDASCAGTRLALELDLVGAALRAAAPLDPAQLVTVNVSAETLVHPELAAIVAGHHGRRLGVELSESSVVTDYGPLREAVRMLGVTLLVDDAGTLHSDRQRVRDAVPHIVKIDRAVVRAAVNGGDPGALRGFVRVAHEVGALALAEGVESPDEVRALAQAGCDLGQGFLFGHPAPAAVWAA